MRALKTSITEIEEEIRLKRAALAEAATETEREVIGKEIQALNAQLAPLRSDFDGVAAGIDLEAYSEGDETAVNLGAEMEDFLRPIVTQLKEVTERPREIDELKKKIAYQTTRKDLAASALDHVSKLLSSATDPALISDLEAVQKTWQQRLEQAENNLNIAEFQLDSKRSEGGSVFRSLSSATADFFRTRGRNLLLALVGFVMVLSGLRFLHRLLHRLSPMRKRGRRSIAVRVIDIAYYGFTVVASTGVILVVFYVTDDWLLLGLALLFLAGIAWTGKRTLPLFYEQAKLMLNLGSVREGERVFYNGIPWKVESINVFTDLTNPALQGGRLRLPLRELVPLLSRPFEPKEPWFPCEEDNWVVLADETYGKVVSQTPEWVQIVQLGGSRKTYNTGDFIAQTPENLSTNYRINVIFGIDYGHQPISTTKVPKIFHQRLEAGLQDLVGEDNLLNLNVEFREAGASSLDYEILADFSGDAASRYKKLQRAISRICVDVCNENNWVIPFTQITLHQASAVDDG